MHLLQEKVVRAVSQVLCRALDTARHDNTATSTSQRARQAWYTT